MRPPKSRPLWPRGRSLDPLRILSCDVNSSFIYPSLSLSLPFQYSLDNEAERKRLEDEDKRLRSGGGLGPQRRAQHVEALRRVEAELEGLGPVGPSGPPGTSSSTSPSSRSGSSSLRMADPAMRAPPRSSAMLEQLYHEALPAPPILSNSGPPNLVYSSASNLFHQVSFLLDSAVKPYLRIKPP